MADQEALSAGNCTVDSLIFAISQLQDTFVPYLLIVVGVGAIIFALLEQIGWEFEITPGRQIWFAGIGGLMAVVGTALIIFPQVVQAVEEMVPTPAPTDMPAPFVRIIEPAGELDCTGGGASCRFEVSGVAGGVLPQEDYLVYIFVFPVDPPGPGFFIQRPAARLNEGGTWRQFPSLAGNLSTAVESGDVIRVQAALLERNATYNGTRLNELPANFYLGALNDIAGLTALSQATQLTASW